MKLSAPPPPPPPPLGDGAPEASDPNQPADAAPPESAPPETPPEAPLPKLLKWPSWYSGVDSALAALVLVLAFAASSFVARNSDVWLHLAAGKRLFAGQYTPGSDPFSYSAADRAWVNHSWLLDAAAYLLYGGNGVVLVVAKALVVVFAFGLLIAIRRPQFPLWPWAVVTCVAVIACAPQFVLRPLVVSMLFLSVTLYLLFRMPQKPGTWRFPIAIGVTFWLWSNSDPWFFVGPLALALLIVGEFIQTKLLIGVEDAPAAGSATPEEPLGRLPDMESLAKALGIGLLACMLNPHHIRVWELPFELIGAQGVSLDPRFARLLISPASSSYMSDSDLGANMNGVAYGLLLVAGAAVLGFGPGRVRVAHVTLWIGFAALSLLSLLTIPFFAIIAVPLVAAQLNALSARAELKTWGDPKTRVLLIGSSIGRLVCVAGICVLCVLAYPGWVHPDPGNPAYARRVAWGVEPEPSLVQAAEQFKKWRETGRLPADARGVIAHPDLANYVAWFAPQEKVFLNARFNHHRAELNDYIAIRRGLGLIEVKDELPNPKDATDVLTKVNAEYVALHGGPGDGNLRARASDSAAKMYREWGDWSTWYVDGRTTIFGWRGTAAARPSFASMRVDPVALAFGPTVTPQPELEIKAPLAPLGWEEPFVRPAHPGPVGSAEAIGWMRYKEALTARQRLRTGLLREAFFAFPAVAPHSLHSLSLWAADGRGLAATPVPPEAMPRVAATMPLIWYLDNRGALRFRPRHSEADDDAMASRAAAFLSLRAARRAIAADPEHPDPYYALAQVLRDPDLPLTESERSLGLVTAYRQCLSRLPPPERYKRGQFLAEPLEVTVRLAELYLGQASVRKDPRTGQEIVVFPGMPVDIAPLNEIIGQALFEHPSGAVVRVPVVAIGQIPPSTRLRLVSGETPYFLSLDLARETLKLAKAYSQTSLAKAPGDAVKSIQDEIEKLAKAVDTAIIRANEQLEAIKASAPALPEMVHRVLTLGLTGEALRLMTEKGADLEKEYKERLTYAAVLRVSLELVTGQIENANDILGNFETPDAITAVEKSGFTRQVQLLKYQKALHAGQYKTAGEVWEVVAGRTRINALMAEIAKEKIDPRQMLFAEFAQWPPPIAGGALGPALVYQFAIGDRYVPAMTARDRILNVLQAEANFYFRRGILSLLEGDIPAARHRFQQCTRKPPDGWGLPELTHADAPWFLMMLEIAARKPVW